MKGLSPILRKLYRDALVLLTLVGHLLVAVGVPLPASKRSKGGGVAYPCQSLPCGCSDSEQCWAGDCCCYTLEEKLAWAEQRGIEPPEHVRPSVESRKFRAAPPKKSCCSESDVKSCETKPPAEDPVRWVGGVYSQKCRGDSPAALIQDHPIFASDWSPVEIDAPAETDDALGRADRPTRLTHTPPARPPRTFV